MTLPPTAKAEPHATLCAVLALAEAADPVGASSLTTLSRFCTNL
jgi:hypothetical protein